MQHIQSSLGPLTIARATAEELPLIMEILDQAAQWMLANGIEQWSSPPPAELWEFMGSEIAKGEVYLARTEANQTPIATLRFGWSEQRLWQDESDSAGYVYTLATHPSVHGHGIGETLLKWAATHIKRQQRPYFRLDCLASNLGLQHYYKQQGFRFCGYATCETHEAALFEMAL